jgi:DNA-binding CsgD family transcriptional regulator
VTQPRRLSISDHQILLALIRGKRYAEIAHDFHMPSPSVRTRVNRMKILTGCQTTFQLIALEVINLMEAEEDKFLALEPKAAASHV